MWICLLLICLLCAGVARPAPKPGENLLTNPGFEVAADNLPADWEWLRYGGTVAWDNRVAYSGKASVRVTDHGGVSSGFVPYLGGVLKVSAWSKLSDVKRGAQPWNTAAIQVISYDANKKSVGHHDIMLAEGTRDWKRSDGTVRYGRDVAFVRVQCHIWNGTGTAWFDDVSLSYADDPAKLERRPLDLQKATVEVDVSKRLGAFRHLWIGTDVCYPDRVFQPINSRTYPYYAKAGFRYLRIHNMVRATGVYSQGPDGQPHYNFKRMDDALDALKRAGFYPVFVIEGTPPQFATGDSGVDYRNPYPPRDFRKWYDLIYAIVAHCKQRYGDDIRKWYWEVWNEPGPDGTKNSYYCGSLQDLLRIYDFSVAGATAVDDRIRIGGFGGAPPVWTEELLRHCTSGRNHATGRIGARIDFVDWHLYTTSVGIPVFDECEAVPRAAQEMVARYPNLGKLPIIITEFGAASSANTAHDRTYDAAFRAMCVKHFMNHGIQLALPFCIADDCYSKAGAFSGDLGMFTRDTISKPSFQAFRLLQQMLGTRVEARCATDPVDALACSSADGKKVWVLLWNLVERPDGPAYSTKVALHLSGLSPEPVTIRATAITPGHTDPFSLWQKLGSPSKLSPEQITQLRAAAALRPAESLGEARPREGHLELTLEIPGYSLHLLEFDVARG